ncbi:hypothetical protein [Paludibaculum fermentans]
MLLSVRAGLRVNPGGCMLAGAACHPLSIFDIKTAERAVLYISPPE